MKTARNREDRTIVLRAAFGFEDAARLRRALDVTLGEDIHPAEMGYAMSAVFGRRKARATAEAWVRGNWDALRKKLPGRLGAVLIRAAGVGCTTTDVDERTEFYTPRAASIDGATRELAGALEALSLCAALHEKGAPSLRRALLGQK
jgi:hypothetical protein